MATYYIGADVHSNSIEMAIQNRKKIVNRINSFTLEKNQLDRMVEKMREIVREVDDAERDIAECMLKAGGKPRSYLKKCREPRFKECRNPN